MFECLLESACLRLWQEEILGIAAKVYLSGHSLLVIDTENKFVSTGFAKEIARVAQGETPLNLLVHTP